MNLMPDLIATFFLFIFMLVLLCFSPFLGDLYVTRRRDGVTERKSCSVIVIAYSGGEPAAQLRRMSE